jgi:hypothetical protein
MPKSPATTIGHDSNATDGPTRIGSYEVHPYANWFPIMVDDQFEEFLKDIEEHGQQTPVVFLEDKILEGRNRAKAVDQLGKELKTVNFEELGTNQKPLEYVISSNLHRRHLTDTERLEIATQLAKLLKEQAAESGNTFPLYKNQNETGRGNKGPASIAAAQMGVSKQAVNQALAREAAVLKYREHIANRLSGEKSLEEFFEKLDQGEILSGPSDLKLFAELPSVRMKQLLKHVLLTATYRAAQDREEEEETVELKTKLRDRLQRLVVEEFKNRGAELGSFTEEKATLQDALKEAPYDELVKLIGFTPSVREDLNQIDRRKITEAIKGCHHLHKYRPSHLETKISFKEILNLLDKSTSSEDGASEPRAPEPDKEPPRKRSTEELQAIERIVRLCAGDTPEAVAGWRRELANIQTDDLLHWNEHDDEAIRKIARLTHGNFGKGLRHAIRIVDQTIDGRTSISELKYRCDANGGRWEHVDDEFRITVARGTAFDREQVNRQLCDAAADIAEHEQIVQALERNKWGLSDDALAGLNSLGKPLLKKVLPCLLFSSGPNNDEEEISFEE